MNLPWIRSKCSALDVDDIWKHAFGGVELTLQKKKKQFALYLARCFRF